MAWYFIEILLEKIKHKHFWPRRMSSESCKGFGYTYLIKSFRNAVCLPGVRTSNWWYCFQSQGNIDEASVNMHTLVFIENKLGVFTCFLDPITAMELPNRYHMNNFICKWVGHQKLLSDSETDMCMLFFLFSSHNKFIFNWNSIFVSGTKSYSFTPPAGPLRIIWFGWCVLQFLYAVCISLVSL